MAISGKTVRRKMRKKAEPEKLDEEEIYLNYIVGLHLTAKKLKVSTETFTLDNKLTSALEKLAKAELNKDKANIKIYRKEARNRLKEIELLCKKSLN